MEKGRQRVGSEAVARAQRLRLRRILGGCLSFACTGLVVVCSWLFGYLEGARVLHFALAVIAINAVAITLLLTNLNLRLKDPSMTGPLIIASIGPSVYVMLYVEEPMVRAAFLLMGTVAMLYGALAFDFRRMLQIGGIALVTYLLMVLALYNFAPERVDLRVELVLSIAYGVVLSQIAFLGSFIAGLRKTLREKNASLMKTMAELEELATRDPLTRLPNRRTAMQQLERELTRSERRRSGEEGLCIGLLDVDNFKRVNDEHGHQAGDEVLRLIGETLNETMRHGDFVARFGGEEFLIILPDTALEGGEAAAERLRQAISGIGPDRLPVPGPITVSIGLAAHRDDRRIEETLGLADRALYQAKNGGRDRVAVWREPRPVGASAFG
ncbi:MAG TPA: GGDEF domain-containing protein [Pseudomonadales bacterium]